MEYEEDDRPCGRTRGNLGTQEDAQDCFSGGRIWEMPPDILRRPSLIDQWAEE